jgi:hypothetical protein
MTTKQIDILLSLKPTGNGAKQVVNDLKAVEAQANRTREKMEKLANVGSKLALAGGAIVAPFALALKKYVDTAKETEPISKRLVALNKKWEESQVRLGRVTAEIVLPALEKGAVMLEKVISFAEQNPGVVQAALTIGGTLVILGGLIASTAQLVSTVATIQGLAASAGIALGGGGAAAGAASGAGLAAGISAGFASIIPALVSALVAGFSLFIGGNIGLWIGNALAGTNQTWADILVTVKQLAVIAAFGLDSILKVIGLNTEFAKKTSELLFSETKKATSSAPVTGAASEIAKATTVPMAAANTAIENQAVQHANNMVAISSAGYAQEINARTMIQNKNFEQIIQHQRKGFSEQLKDWVANQQAGLKAQAGYMKSVAKFTSDFYKELAQQTSEFGKALGYNAGGKVPGMAVGGYASNGLYHLGEGTGALSGPEFVMNAQTTRNAERAIGGGLTQASAASYMTANINLSNGMTISQQKRALKKSENAAFNRMMSVVGR